MILQNLTLIEKLAEATKKRPCFNNKVTDDSLRDLLGAITTLEHLMKKIRCEIQNMLISEHKSSKQILAAARDGITYIHSLFSASHSCIDAIRNTRYDIVDNGGPD